MALLYIAQRKRTAKGGYRTSYYRECVDGRPKFGAKRKAVALDEAEAELVLGQVRVMLPRGCFEAINVMARPKRLKAYMVPEDAKPPTQEEAFT